MEFIFFAVLVIIIGFLVTRKKDTAPKPVVTPDRWKEILLHKVHFYRSLDERGKLQFETDVQRFLKTIRITGVETNVTLADRLLVASSAVITLFGFPAWSFQYLNEVILFPSHFDKDLNIGSKNEIITGMVGNGLMEGKMILSKPALHAGFNNPDDKMNVGIHEFIHIFDKEDGMLDGVPPILNNKKYTLPWLDFVKLKTNQILLDQSDIHPYAAYNQREFLAVTGEYFFERPDLLKKKHPKLYEILCEVFRQDPSSMLKKPSDFRPREARRNDLCPCGSGNKYKQCCQGQDLF